MDVSFVWLAIRISGLRRLGFLWIPLWLSVSKKAPVLPIHMRPAAAGFVRCFATAAISR